MALKVLMLRREIEDMKPQLEELRGRAAGFETREADLAASIGEAETAEERAAVEEAVGQFEAEKEETAAEIARLETAIREAETKIGELEAAQRAGEPPAAAAKPNEERGVDMNKSITIPEAAAYSARDAARNNLTRSRSTGPDDQFAAQPVYLREDVRDFLQRVRSLSKQERSVKGADLTIPDVLLEIIRENVGLYSKLTKYVNLKPVKGNARQIVAGSIPEAVWTEMVATLNKLEIQFMRVEVDGYKVGGYMAIPISTLEDSDLNLASEILTAIGQAIGYALDKAIIYGTGTKMPQGFLTRIAQTTEPSGYSSVAPPWKDIHATNLQQVASSVEGAKFFSAMLLACGNITSKYARGGRFWAMNEYTHSVLMSKALVFNAAGAIVAQTENTMPIVGGNIEILDFIPDGDIIGGYGENYLLVERSGSSFAQSEHAQFIEDNILFKGTARYDGMPVIADAFLGINIEGKAPTTTVTFAHDAANETQNP